MMEIFESMRSMEKKMQDSFIPVEEQASNEASVSLAQKQICLD